MSKYKKSHEYKGNYIGLCSSCGKTVTDENGVYIGYGDCLCDDCMEDPE